MPKRAAPLSARHVANLKPGQELIDGQLPGLRARMSPGGRLTWSLNIRDSRGERRRFDVGQGLGLAEARVKAEEIRRVVKAGQDPTKERKAARERAAAAQQGIGTLASVVHTYFESGPGAALATRGEQVKRIKSVFADHLNRPTLDLRPADLQISVDRHPAGVSAARAVMYARPVLAWAAKRGLAPKGFDELEKPLERRVQRVLSREEIGAILPHLGDEYGRAARFLLLTATRMSEATGATWAEFDLASATWKIPGTRRKDTRARTARNGAKTPAFTVPLSRQAVALLQQLGPGQPNELVFRGERGGSLVNWDRWLKRIFAKSGTRDWSAHALRRTAATMAGELGTPPHIVEVILGHRNIGGQLHAGYNQSRYRAEHADALQRLADELDRLGTALQRSQA